MPVLLLFNVVYDNIIDIRIEECIKNMDLLDKKKALIALCDILHNDIKPELHVSGEINTDELYLVDTSIFNENCSIKNITDETEAVLNGRHPDGWPIIVSIKFIDTKNRGIQPTLEIDFENNEIVFVVPVDYNIKLNEVSKLIVLA